MTTPSWRSLRVKKYQLSLRLFLFLNAVSALFTLVFPLYQINVFCTPMIGILLLSILLLIWHGKYGQKRINLPLISLLFGGLWAVHIALKYPALGHYDFSFLLISLLSVLFIGSIAFAANIVAFTLHSLPSVAVCLWLNGNEQGLRILYLLAPANGGNRYSACYPETLR
nr:diguanylate cyclase [Salmonella sp. NCTC 7297]